MCGIAGLIDPHTRIGDHRQALFLMSEEIATRGPDGKGDFLDEQLGIGLTHRRLAVFDTSDSGAQPMTSGSGRFTIVYNGAIYNHPELREALRDRGNSFTSSSDTEVMLAAFEEWGVEESLSRFNGMFAFAVLDRQANQLIIARDRIGQKPICIASANGAVAFASDLRALQALPEPFASACKDINPIALRWYLANGAVPWPMSILKHVECLAPGSLCAIDLHTAAITRKSWWTPAKFQHDEASDDDGEGTERLLQCLNSAVQLRLRSDRPVGVFLSGGLDSRLIAALAARHDPTVRAFTLQLPGPFDESAQAAEIASRLGIPHHCFEVSETEILDTATRLHELCDGPFADSSLLATTILAQRSREEIVVALGGDGGDELFGGYRRHAAAFGGQGPTAMFATALGKLPQAFSGRIPIGRLSLAEALHRTSLFDHKGADYLGLRATQGNAEWLLAPPAGMQAATDWLRKFENSSPPWDGMPFEYLSAREMMLADLRTYLPDDPLVKIDRATMSVALEARSPMLDHEVIETALNMPTSQLFDSRGGRAPIRAMLRSLDMPDTSEKRGFAVPLFRWLRGPLRDWASSLLLEGDEDPLDQTAVADIWRQLLDGRRDRAVTIWTVLCWRSWLQGRFSR